MNKQMERMLTGAKNYAAANSSDPFAYSRAISHIRSGIAGVHQDGSDAFYDAEPFQEERKLPDGRTYTATAYKNIKRP